jgi:hypothetical protein
VVPAGSHGGADGGHGGGMRPAPPPPQASWERVRAMSTVSAQRVSESVRIHVSIYSTVQARIHVSAGSAFRCLRMTHLRCLNSASLRLTGALSGP